jgi:hypothetical protein
MFQVLVIYIALFKNEITCRRTAIMDLINEPRVENHRDVINSWESKTCMLATSRMEAGPADPANYSSTEKFKDMSFYEYGQLWWDGYIQGEGKLWEFYLKYNYYNFTRFPEIFPNHPLFDTQGPHFNDIKQGGAGTCYILASLGAIAEFPYLVYDAFQSGRTISESGLYNLKFYIRGKPWIVSVDDYMLFDRLTNKLVFT